MPNIFFCGDIHGHFRHIIAAVERERPDAIVLLGDIEAARPLEMELASILDKTVVRFIPGNHDTDSDFNYRYLFESSLADCTLHGRVETIAGVRIAGLGGIFRNPVWMPPADASFGGFDEWRQSLFWGQPPQNAEMLERMALELGRTHQTTIFPDVYDRLSLLEADVLVTHEAPSSHLYGFEAIDDLAQALGVRRSFHGHHHDRLDYQSKWPGLGFQAHGVGFCGITDLDGRVVRAGDFDDVRDGTRV